MSHFFFFFFFFSSLSLNAAPRLNLATPSSRLEDRMLLASTMTFLFLAPTRRVVWAGNGWPTTRRRTLWAALAHTRPCPLTTSLRRVQALAWILSRRAMPFCLVVVELEPMESRAFSMICGSLKMWCSGAGMVAPTWPVPRAKSPDLEPLRRLAGNTVAPRIPRPSSS